MALLHWRKFVFFDEEIVKDTELNQLVEEDPTGSEQQIVTVKLSCSNSGRGSILLGDENGYIYIINKNLRVNSFRANQKFTSHVKQVPKLPLIITCGSDQEGVIPLIKLWDPEKEDTLNQPTCVKVIRANSGFTIPVRVTCIECNDQLTLMIVGFADGTVVLYQDVAKRRRLKKSGLLKVSDKGITGIALCGEARSNQNIKLVSASGYLGQSSSHLEITAFISTKDEIFYSTLAETTLFKVQLDTQGCSPRCFCLLPGSEAQSLSENLFAVGRDDAVYFYQVDGRGPCLAFEGDKIMLYRFKTYLVIISREAPSKISTTNPLRPRVLQSSEPGDPARRKIFLNIYDIKNKYIAHSSIVPDIQEVFSEWGHLFVICANGRIIMFREKDTQTKLETLFKKNQFSLVIDIAKSLHYDEDAMADIYQHYGDHLFRKGDFDGAIAQYIKTIGRLEPTFVIKKFLDSKRLVNLTTYLEALHQKSHASQEHTKILLNCYSKLKNDDQLKQFIESYEVGNIKFDVEVAIKVLRGANFHESAIYLAKKHKKHELFFKIQVEDNSNIDAALDFMNQMNDPDEIAVYMKKHGRMMLKYAPDKTIQTIKMICQKRGDVEPTFNAFGSRDNPRQIYPEEFFHIFVEKNDLFVRLLEQLVDGGTDFATKAVHNLLLELYLNTWLKEKDDLTKNFYADKINKLLSQPSEKLDLNQALILCRNNRFDDGLIELYGRVKLYHLVLQYHIDQDDSLRIMKTCEAFGSIEPQLYMPALIHYAMNGDERLCQLLKAIEHQKAIGPMVVIKILLDSKRANLASVKEYLVRFLGKLNDRHIENMSSVDHYKDDTDMIRNKIDKFKNHHIIFRPSKCAACNDNLNLPSVHFLCNHSYHQYCFYNHSAESDECPICVTANQKLLDEIGSHETSKSSLEILEKQLAMSDDDVFNSLARLFGFGLFNE